MADSTLVTREWWANPTNYTANRSAYGKVGGIVVHHAASTSLDSVGQVFSQVGRNGSAHYGVKGTQVHQYVKEQDIAWHCSNWFGNCNTIGIETINSTGAPNWEVDELTFDTLCRLIADIAKRYGWARVDYNPNDDLPTLSAHKDWQGSATACPGPYLYPRMKDIETRVNTLLKPIPAPAPATIEWEKFPEVKIYTTNKQPTKLWNFNQTSWAGFGSGIKDYNQGDKIGIYGKAINQLGGTYLVTEYSFTKGITNGFNIADMDAFTEEVEIPQTEPEKPTQPVTEPIKDITKDEQTVSKPEPDNKPLPPEETIEEALLSPDFIEEHYNRHGLSEEVFNKLIEKGTLEMTSDWKPIVPDGIRKWVYYSAVGVPAVTTLTTQLLAVYGYMDPELAMQTLAIVTSFFATICGALGIAHFKNKN